VKNVEEFLSGTAKGRNNRRAAATEEAAAETALGEGSPASQGDRVDALGAIEPDVVVLNGIASFPS
jgi:hypothetical protein